MKPPFQERHQDYVLSVALLAPGQILTGLPLVLDLDAPFVVRSRAFYVHPTDYPSDSGALPGVQTGLETLKTSFTGPDENYVSQQRVPANLHSYCFGQQGNPTPVFPQMIYPAGGVIYVDVENTSSTVTLTKLRLVFRGVKLYKWGTRPGYTYPPKYTRILPFAYPLMVTLPIETLAPVVEQVIIQPDADFVLRGGKAGLSSPNNYTAGGLAGNYRDVSVTVRDEDGKAYSNAPVPMTILFGEPSSNGSPSYDPENTTFLCGGIQTPAFFSGLGLFYPEIYILRQSVMYFDFTRDDSSYSSVVGDTIEPVTFPVTLQGVKVMP